MQGKVARMMAGRAGGGGKVTRLAGAERLAVGGCLQALVKQNWALSPSGAELAHSVDLSRIPEKTKLHCSPQMEASVSWVTALISSFLLLPLLSGP